MKYPNHVDIAKAVGDTFIDYKRNTPVIQWSKICFLLNDMGFCIVHQKDADRLEEFDKATAKQLADWEWQEEQEG